MNNVVKVSLTIVIEGCTLVRKSSPDTLKYKITKQEESLKRNKKASNHVIKEGVNKHYTLISKPASMHVNLTQEAYDYMTSNEFPSGIKMKDWKHMSKVKRLEWHLQKICDNYQGKSFSYEILGD